MGIEISKEHGGQGGHFFQAVLAVEVIEAAMAQRYGSEIAEQRLPKPSKSMQKLGLPRISRLRSCTGTPKSDAFTKAPAISNWRPSPGNY